jgi:hypothetical protein
MSQIERASPAGEARHDDGPAKATESRSVFTVAWRPVRELAARLCPSAAPGNADTDLAEQLARRREAALRLPPMDCGCRDPESPDHLADRCRYPRRIA